MEEEPEAAEPSEGESDAAPSEAEPDTELTPHSPAPAG